MRDPARITEPLLDVMELLVQAAREGRELHGWALMKGTGRSGPTIYGVLDRLEDAGWVTGRSEQRNPEPGRPPRRFYSLTPEALVRAGQVLDARRHRQNPARSPRRGGIPRQVLQAARLGAGQ